MKVSSMLFSLLVACQALPVTMHAAAAQSQGEAHAWPTDDTRAFVAGQFGPESLRMAYNFALTRLEALAGKPQAYTYDMVTDTSTTLAGDNAIKTQQKTSYAYDKAGRARTVSSTLGVERIIIADPTTQTVYLVCPELKEIQRMRGAALASSPGAAPAWKPDDADKPGEYTDLGEKEIAGVKASGIRSETVIPAGVQGNSKPLVHTFETWYSMDLANIVYFRTTMPESQDIVMHVENLKFGDVPASTFALPEGYAIRDIALAGNDAK